MAKFHFFYAVMNAGKSTALLQANHNYTVNGSRTLLFTSSIDNRAGVGKISSRLGLSEDATALSEKDDVFEIVKKEHRKNPVQAVLMDEIQFMTPEHIYQASEIVDRLNIPVMAYGLKNNSQGELFSKSVATILALADKLAEQKQTCHCGSKANMILRYNPDGTIVKSGPVVEVGAENRYVSVCRKHYKDGNIGPYAASRLSKKVA